MGHLKYKGYVGSVDYSEEDNCLYGKVLGMNKDVITYEGNTTAALKADFEAAIDFYLKHCKKTGIEPKKPYTGTLNIRIPSEVHSKVALEAELRRTSINAVIKEALVQHLHCL